MKNLKTLSVLAAGVASCALLCQPAFGQIWDVTTGTPIVGSGVDGNEYLSELTSSPSGNAITVAWEVTKISASDYLYVYAVNNYGTSPTGPNLPGTMGAAGPRTLSVFFNASGATANTPTYNSGGTPPAYSATINPLVSVFFTFPPLGPGGSTPGGPAWAPGPFGGLPTTAAAANAAGYFAFQSPYDFVLGNANSTDGIQFASVNPQGEQVAVPNVPPTPPLPDGGMTLSLLGFALMGLEGLRRKLGK